jgi:hypothetical protein
VVGVTVNMCARGDLICALGVTVLHITDHFKGTILTDIKITYDGTQAVPKRVSVVLTLLCV